MEETPGNLCTSHQFSGKKGTHKKQLSLARAQKLVVEQNVDCFRPIITNEPLLCRPIQLPVKHLIRKQNSKVWRICPTRCRTTHRVYVIIIYCSSM